MAYSCQLTAVQCGMAVALFGAIWSQVELSLFLEFLAANSSTFGFILIWLGITIASVTGASKVLPIAGAGFSATITSELMEKILVRAGSLLSLITCTVWVLGLSPLLE